jgi:lantibiotic modifying enzyme
MRHPVWIDVGTDRMRLGRGGLVESDAHRVRLHGRHPPARQYLPSVRTGFRAAYFAIHRKRRQLASDLKLLRHFDALELRVLLRDSATYARLHLHLLHPEFLEDGLDRSIELEWLARPLSVVANSRAGRSLEARARVYEHEWRAMEQLDVPHFGTSAWRRLSGGHRDEQLPFSGKRDAGVLRRRLASLSRSDCRRQLATIARSLRGASGRSR